MKRALPLVLVLLAACANAGERPSVVASERLSVSPSPSSSAPTRSLPSPTASASTPRPVAPLYVAVKGDWGSGTAVQQAITNRMCAVRERAPFDTVITTGDNFYDPDGRAVPGNYSTPERCLLDGEDHRWRAAWGNHDVRGTSTGTTLGARRYYAWRLPGVDVIVLDSNRTADTTQRAWLRSRLREARGPVKIVVFHHPPYTVGSAHTNDEGVQKYWVPLFEQYGVDLVLNGHSHLYEHHRRNGIDYVVTGGGGRYRHLCAREPATLKKCSSEYHFLLLSFTPGKIGVEAIRRDGSTLDRFSILL